MTDDDWDFSRPAAPSAHAAGFPPVSSAGTPTGIGPTGAAPNPFEQSAFGGTAGGNSVVSGQVGPPTGWLLAAATTALAGLIVAALTLSGGIAYMAGWAIAGPVSIGLLTVYARRDAARQTAVFYSFPAWKPAAYRAVLLLSLVAVIADALRIADWAGHR